MMTVTSKDGTKIAYEKTGQGPALVVVVGALSTSGSVQDLAELLQPFFTIYTFDRRSRGQSGNTFPYSVAKEIDDIEAIIDAAGGNAFVYGHSSGAVLALYAAERLADKVKRLAVYEIPFNDETGAIQITEEYQKNLLRLLNDNNYGEAVSLFLKLVDISSDRIAYMRQTPFWSELEKLAPTLIYDTIEIVGTHSTETVEKAKNIFVPTLVMYGTDSPEFMKKTAIKFSNAISKSKLRPVERQAHNVKPYVISGILVRFFRTELDTQN